jgi:hypothetical protein
MEKEMYANRLQKNTLGFSIDVLSSNGTWVTMYQLNSVDHNSAVIEANALISIWNKNGGRYHEVK